MLRVLFVDDEPRLRDCWVRLLEAHKEFALVGTLDRADRLVETVKQVSPDIVILDLTMPGALPLAACRELAAAAPNARVIIYSGLDDAEQMDAAFEAGAWGYVDKLLPPDAIFDVMRTVAQGELGFPNGHVFDRA